MLLSGEYGVLDGAEALALPTRFGQRMLVKSAKGSNLVWESLDRDGNTWFSAVISLYDFSASKTQDDETAGRLKNFLKNAVRLNSEFLSKWNGFKVETQLDFPRDWGLGSSSTLVYNLAQWAGVNPIMLALKATNGSGYDVACAGADQPIVYKSDDESISFSEVDFYPDFSSDLYFVHLGQKASSEDAVKYYIKTVKNKSALVKEQSALTDAFLEANSKSTFNNLLDEHENVVSHHLKKEKVKDLLFSDFFGSIKSLGAWGGDFILASSDLSSEETFDYFKKKGYPTVIEYDKMVLDKAAALAEL